MRAAGLVIQIRGEGCQSCGAVNDGIHPGRRASDGQGSPEPMGRMRVVSSQA